MNLKEMRAAAFAAAQTIIDGAKTATRDLTADEVKAVNEKIIEVKALDVKIQAAKDGEDAIRQLGLLTTDGVDKRDNDGRTGAKTLGEHFVKTLGSQFAAAKGTKFSLATDEWAGPESPADGAKAATTTQTIGSIFTPVLTEIDRTIMPTVRPRLVVADLLGQGTIGPNTNAITYFVEAGLEGAFTTVAEGGAKPQLHFLDPTTVTDSLKKIAGFIKLSDEMQEDLDYIVSEINNRLLYERAKFEEAQIMSGDGTGTNLQGLLNRSGVQTLLRGTVASGDTVADTIFRAMTAVTTGSGLDPDGIVINPLDYQALRLAKDANGQYYGGGFFAGQYGNGTLMSQPPLWGLRTVVTPAVAVGTVLVGAFASAATLYRKGGVRVESTNSDGTDFRNNIITIRVENRVALAVRRPAGFVKTTITAAP